MIAPQPWLPRESDPRYHLTAAYDATGLSRLLGLAFYAHGMAIRFLPHRLAPKHSYAAWDLSAETLLRTRSRALLRVVSLLALVWRRARNGPLVALLMLLIGPVLSNNGLS